MRSWLLGSVAILGEVVATSALKSSVGFTKFVPSIIVVVGYALAFYFLSLALKSIPLGIAYAVWSGLGIVLVAGIAWFFFTDKSWTFGPLLAWVLLSAASPFSTCSQRRALTK